MRDLRGRRERYIISLASDFKPTRAAVGLLHLLVISFLICGLTVIPHIGIQTDEAIFTNVLFPNAVPLFDISVFKQRVPLMVMTYLGTTKAALYRVIWQIVDPCPYSLRVPVLLLGIASIYGFYFFLRRTGPERVALIGASLLATDTCYLFTTTLDWGPVAIQHLCLIFGLLLLLKAYQTAHLLPLAGGAFWLGLGVWDKAIFLWILSGAVLAALAVFPKEIWRYLSVRRIIVFGFFFLLGALPLVIYNVRKPLATFQGNASFSTADVWNKLPQAEATANGSVLFGYLVEEDWAVRAAAPTSLIEKASLSLQALTKERRRHWNGYALVLALGLCPVLLFTRYRRPLLFALLTMLIAWGQMLVTRNAGGGAHHTILLWPFPLMVIAIAIGWLSEKAGVWRNWVTALLSLSLIVPALLTTNQFMAQAIRNGGPGVWTNAIYNLSARLPSYRAERIYLADWGMLDNTRMLHRGELPLHIGSEPLMRPDPTPEARADFQAMLRVPNTIWVTNTDQREAFTGVNKNLVTLATQLGYRKQPLETIYDFNGRACFEIFRMIELTPGNAFPEKKEP